MSLSTDPSIRPVACPRCGKGEVVSFVATVNVLHAWHGESLGSLERPTPAGEEKSQYRCEACGARWVRGRDFKRDWTAAGRPLL